MSDKIHCEYCGKEITETMTTHQYEEGVYCSPECADEDAQQEQSQ